MAASGPPCAMAELARKRTTVLYRNAAAAPMATRVSMLGARWSSPWVPLMKYFWLMTMTMAVSSSSNSPMDTWFPARKGGRGQFQSICPMDTYIMGSRMQILATRRRTILGVSLSSSSAGVPLAFSAVAGAAP